MKQHNATVAQHAGIYFKVDWALDTDDYVIAYLDGTIAKDGTVAKNN